MSKQIIFSTKEIEQIEKDFQIGIQPVGKQSPYLMGQVGVRKGGIAFAVTAEEENEYIGDLAYTITVKAKTWEDSFNKAKEGYYMNTKDRSILYNFTSEEVC